MPSSWPRPLMGGTDPWDGGDADPLYSPLHAVALQEGEKSRILKPSRQTPVCSKLLLHAMVCEHHMQQVRPWDNPTNIIGETFAQ